MVVASLVCVAGAGAWQMAKTGNSMPAPFATPSSNNAPHVVEKPSNANLKLPQGFKATVWAEGFEKPRFMYQGRDGEMLMTDSGSPGKVYVFPNGDASKKKVLITGLERPYGIAQWHEYLYIGEPTSIKRYKYDSKNFTASKGEQIIELDNFSKGHWTRSLLFDAKGEKLYVGVGSGSNVDAGEDPRRAAINQYNPDGSGHVVYASGTRNPIGLHWYPNSQTLWAAVQERDALGDDLVPDYFTHIDQGKFYGWPYAYIGPHEDPRRKGEKPDLVKKAVKPDVLLGAHVAVLDYVFYTGNQFPERYRGGAFLAYHGSWNRSKRVGYEVAFVPFSNGKPSGPPEDFMTGWMLSPDEKEVWGRPVAIFQRPDQTLLVSDDGGNKIWQITYGK
jgi:glucose/arabinose dehydrogenase